MLKFSISIQQQPIPVFGDFGDVITHKSSFLKIKNAHVTAPDPETALCLANQKFPTFRGRLAVEHALLRH